MRLGCPAPGEHRRTAPCPSAPHWGLLVPPWARGRQCPQHLDQGGTEHKSHELTSRRYLEVNLNDSIHHLHVSPSTRVSSPFPHEICVENHPICAVLSAHRGCSQR